MAEYVLRQRRLRYLRGIPLDMRVFRDRSNPLEMYNGEEVRERYRFHPESIMFICGLVEGEVERGTLRSQALPTLLLTLVSLQFLASNAHHIIIGQVHGVSRSSVTRAIRSFCQAMSRHIRRFVFFPADNSTVIKQFYAVAGFPNVVGVIDCTHVKIIGPREDEADFVNRKGFHSINVQMIGDPTFKFVSVVAKWPGSVHDARIWRDCEISGRFDRGEIDGTLLGDSGYPCKRYLLTPYLTPQTPVQERYNNSLCQTRVIIEQCFGVLKIRFPCLSYGLRMKPDRAAAVIVTCVILHNIGIDRNDMLPRGCTEDRMQPDTDPYVGPGTGSHFRDYVAAAFFS